MFCSLIMTRCPLVRGDLSPEKCPILNNNSFQALLFKCSRILKLKLTCWCLQVIFNLLKIGSNYPNSWLVPTKTRLWLPTFHQPTERRANKRQDKGSGWRLFVCDPPSITSAQSIHHDEKTLSPSSGPHDGSGFHLGSWTLLIRKSDGPTKSKLRWGMGGKTSNLIVVLS